LTDQGVQLATQPGIVVQDHEANRWRLLVDRRMGPLGAVLPRGAREIADAPVSLEELFITLGRS
jgi:hypothetical protein